EVLHAVAVVVLDLVSAGDELELLGLGPTGRHGVDVDRRAARDRGEQELDGRERVRLLAGAELQLAAPAVGRDVLAKLSSGDRHRSFAARTHARIMSGQWLWRDVDVVGRLIALHI